MWGQGGGGRVIICVCLYNNRQVFTGLSFLPLPSFVVDSLTGTGTLQAHRYTPVRSVIKSLNYILRPRGSILCVCKYVYYSGWCVSVLFHWRRTLPEAKHRLRVGNLNDETDVKNNFTIIYQLKLLSFQQWESLSPKSFHMCIHWRGMWCNLLFQWFTQDFSTAAQSDVMWCRWFISCCWLYFIDICEISLILYNSLPPVLVNLFPTLSGNMYIFCYSDKVDVSSIGVKRWRRAASFQDESHLWMFFYVTSQCLYALSCCWSNRYSSVITWSANHVL